jgi:hypothetical protein
MLRVTEHNEPGAWRLTLEGTLARRWAAEAERVWSGAPAGKPREVDLRGVTSVDRAGRDLLHRMHHDGASFIAEGVVMKALVEELRSEHFDRAGTIVRLVGVVALIALAPVAAAHPHTIAPTVREPGAQTRPSATLRLTLQQAPFAIGLQQSPEIAIAHLNLVEAQERRTL